MEKPLTITAICGWALPPQWFHGLIEDSFPEAKINVLTPSQPSDTQEAEHMLKSIKADLYIGYSLGSLWLMTYQEMLPQASVKAVLAPVLAFSRERNRGGKTPETKLKYLIRKLKRNPHDLSPLREFYASTGIHFSESWFKNVPDHKTLLNGLEFLQIAPVPQIEVQKFIALVGEEDGFLDGNELKRHLPQLEIVPDTGHAPGPLLNRLAKILDIASNG